MVTSSDKTTIIKAKFDEDSPMYARLGRWRVASEAQSVSLMMRRRNLFDIETGFDVKGKTSAVKLFLQDVWHR